MKTKHVIVFSFVSQCLMVYSFLFNNVPRDYACLVLISFFGLHQFCLATLNTRMLEDIQSNHFAASGKQNANFFIAGWIAARDRIADRLISRRDDASAMIAANEWDLLFGSKDKATDANKIAQDFLHGTIKINEMLREGE